MRGQRTKSKTEKIYIAGGLPEVHRNIGCLAAGINVPGMRMKKLPSGERKRMEAEGIRSIEERIPLSAFGRIARGNRRLFHPFLPTFVLCSFLSPFRPSFFLIIIIFLTGYRTTWVFLLASFFPPFIAIVKLVKTFFGYANFFSNLLPGEMHFFRFFSYAKNTTEVRFPRGIITERNWIVFRMRTQRTRVLLVGYPARFNHAYVSAIINWLPTNYLILVFGSLQEVGRKKESKGLVDTSLYIFLSACKSRPECFQLLQDLAIYIS